MSISFLAQWFSVSVNTIPLDLVSPNTLFNIFTNSALVTELLGLKVLSSYPLIYPKSLNLLISASAQCPLVSLKELL